MRTLCDLLILPVSFCEIAVTHISDGILHAVGEAVCLVVGEANGLVVFHSGLFLISHERVRVTKSELGRDEVWIDLQRGAIVIPRALKLSSHALELPVGILRVRLLRKQGDIAIHGGKRLVGYAVEGIDES